MLANPRSYAYWVVGSEQIRDADPEWPAVGSVFAHAVGTRAVHVNDHTVVEAVKPRRMLRLKAKARPFGTATVTLELRRRGRGTEVTMTERPGDLLSALVHNPLTNLLIGVRNERSLERLKALAERRMTMPDTGQPTRRSVRRRRPATVDRR